MKFEYADDAALVDKDAATATAIAEGSLRDAAMAISVMGELNQGA